MPSSNILPITNLDQVGLVLDRPAPSLPQNAFSDALNVRFRDGSIRKMQGEVNLFPNLFDDSNNLIGGVEANFDGSLVKYVVFWPNPNLVGDNSGYYLVINEESRLLADDTVPPPSNTDPVHQRDIAYLVSVDGTSKVEKGIFEPAPDGEWQHTFFQGGFAIIINNGIDIPSYILDDENNTDINSVPMFLSLPGWESYNVNQIILQDRFDPNEDSYIFDLGQNVDFDINEVVVERINASAPTTVVSLTASGDTGVAGTPNNPSWTPPAFSSMTTTPWSVDDEFEIYFDGATGTTVLNLPDNLSTTSSDTVTVTIRSRNAVEVRAKVIRAYGDFLVAGDLTETDETDPNIVVRSLPGVIRTSDAAKPGAVPNNWNPFAAGVSTADEFVVSDTASVTDMSELQGNLYIYTSTSISVMRLTGNASVPVAIQPVTDSYGCQNTNSVLEFEGKQVVVGSKDIYLFAGNPAGITSVADDRVRRYFYNNMNPTGQNRVFLIDNRQRDEIWVCYPTRSSVSGDCDEALVWNYQNNTWTRRELRGVISGTLGPIPGGGLPETTVDLTGITGDNGVTNVGAYEVRLLGIESTVALDGERLVYSGTGSEPMYGESRVFSPEYRLNDDLSFNFYMDLVYPTLSVTGPDGIDFEYTITNGAGYTNLLSSTDLMDQIVAQLEAQDGWSFYDLPSGYSPASGNKRLISSVDGVDFVGLRDVANIPIDVTVTDIGSVRYGDELRDNIDFQDGSQVASVHGTTVDSTNDYRGKFVKRATPTIMGIQVRSPDKTGGEEMIFLSSGGPGAYDPEDHTGTPNGVTFTDEQTAEAWIDKLRIATSRLDVFDGGTAGEFLIRPASFSEESDIILDVRINDTTDNGDWLWEKYSETVAGTISLNPYSDTPYSNPVNYDEPETQTIDVADNSPSIAGSLDTQYSPDGTRTPNRVTTSTPATMSAVIDVDNFFDVDRPWYRDEVNPNLEFPIMASRGRVNGPVGRPSVNKIIGADVGWTVPSFDYTPRTVTDDPDNFSEIITNNDAPIPYTSYFERKQANISPDMDVETIHQISLWASGSYEPYVNSGEVYNRLQLRVKATDNPGKNIDLTSLVDTTIKKNQFFVSESNKLDTRVTGRYLNYRITDEILDRDDNVLTLTANPKNTYGTEYTQAAQWEISGIQPEVNKGGRR